MKGNHQFSDSAEHNIENYFMNLQVNEITVKYKKRGVFLSYCTMESCEN